MTMSHNYSRTTYTPIGVGYHHILQHEKGVAVEPANAIIDNKDNNVIWIADKKIGLIQNSDTWNIKHLNFSKPYSQNVHKIVSKNNKVWLATGGVNGSQWNNVFLSEGISYYQNEEWTNINKTNTENLDTIMDYIDIAIDPNDENHVFVASFGDGLLEFENDKLKKIFDAKNSTIQNTDPLTKGWSWTEISATNFDAK